MREQLVARRFATFPRELPLLLALVFAVAALGMAFPQFATTGIVSGVLDDTSLLVILALGQALVLLTRAVDLSVAANVALSGMLAALLNQAESALRSNHN